MGLFSSTRDHTSTTRPWGPQANHLESIYGYAQDLYENAPQTYYPGQTWVDPSRQTGQGMRRIERRARQGSPVQRLGNQQMRRTIRGGYLNPASNPYLEATYNAAADPVTRHYREAVAPSISANFSAAGRYGSNMAHTNAHQTAQDTLGRTLGDLGTQIYGGNYQRERGRQLRATAAAPAYAAADYNDANQLLRTGMMREGYQGLELQDQMARHDFAQNEPLRRLDNYLQTVAGQGSFGGQTTTPMYRNPLTGVLGGAMAGSQIGGGLFGGGDWSKGIGTAAGGLLGLFG